MTVSPPPGGASPEGTRGAPLRVLFVVPMYPPPVLGGLERQASELAAALVARGVQVTVLAKAFTPGHAPDAVVDGVRVRRLGRRGAALWPLGLAREMVRLRGSYDVVHVHNMSWLAVAAISTARLLGRPVLAKLPNHGAWGIAGQTGRALGGVWLRGYRRADAVVAMSDESIRELEEIGYPSSRVLRLTNGVSTLRFAPRPRPPRPGAEAVFVGRLDPQKGLFDLLAVWREVAATLPGTVLRIYGDGPQRDQLREQVERDGLQGAVSLEGHAEDIAAALAGGDLFVLPSYAEGSSNAVLEAMACGLPVVSTRLGGTERLVGPAGRPWLIEPGDRDALRTALLALLGDPERSRALGRAMLERAREALDIRVVAALYERAYRCLAGGSPTGVSAISSPVWSDPPAPAPAAPLPA